MKKELLVDFSELFQLSISCINCKTKVLLDCRDREARVPSECPGCGQEYESLFRSSLQNFKEVYRRLADYEGRHVEVRISAEDRTAETGR